LTKKDVVAIGYRKKQLEVFRQLLEDPAYFAALKRRKNCTDEKLSGLASALQRFDAPFAPACSTSTP
jgi:hypothetical protein